MGDETTEEFVPGINVRQLISVYENKSGSNDVHLTRPRSKSWGNVLADDIVVRYNEYYTLQDIQKALETVEVNLNYYQVYDKQKHVTFQEQLFNILTCVINIETESDDDPKKKRDLISKTQTLVSALNKKLPNVKINNKIEQRKPETQKSDTNETLNDRQEIVDNSDESVSLKDGTEYQISVRKLKETFQTKEEVEERKDFKVVSKGNKREKQIIKKRSTTKISTEKQENSIPQPPQNIDNNKKFDESINNSQNSVDKIEEIPDVRLEEPDIPKIVSVSKLRDLFERRGKEESSGLQAILDAPRTFQYDVKIPYTEGNLGKYRIYRANSGYYMNQPGLLKNVDIIRSKSMHDFGAGRYTTYKDQKKIKDNYQDELGEESDASSESVESVKEANINTSSAIQVNLGQVEKLSRTFDIENEKEFNSAEVTEAPYVRQIELSRGTVEDEEIKYFSSRTVQMKKTDSSDTDVGKILINDNIALIEDENKSTEDNNLTTLDDTKYLEDGIAIQESHSDIQFSEAKSVEFSSSSVPTSTISDGVKEVQVTYASARRVESSNEINTLTTTVNGELTQSVETKIELQEGEDKQFSGSNIDKTTNVTITSGNNEVRTLFPDASIHSISEMSLDEETLRKAEEEFDSLVEINDIA